MSRHFLFAVVLAAACDRPDSPETAAQKAQLADARATCVKLFQRQRACTDAFIPALVDLRRELDRPAGIAQAPREELVAAAHAEWKDDSTDGAIEGQCDRLAQALPAPAVASAKGCIAVDACGEFVTCVMPLMRDQLAK
jgi:hypothetical protein